MARNILSRPHSSRLETVIKELASEISDGALRTHPIIAAHINKHELMRCRNDAADVVLPHITEAHVKKALAAVNHDREVAIQTPMQVSRSGTARAPRAAFSTAMAELTRLTNKELMPTLTPLQQGVAQQLLVTLKALAAAVRDAVRGDAPAADDTEADDAAISAALSPTAPLLNQQNQPPRDTAHATNVGSHSVTALSAPPK